MGSQGVWVIVSCMGRREFVRRTAPMMLARRDVGYCLVDYSCPERSGDWIEETYPKAAAEGRLLVERVVGCRHFNKCAALNAGARRAIRAGARWLCFLDADTIVRAGFFDWIGAELDADRFLIADLRPDGSDPPSLTGVLVVSSARFAETAGYDEAFRGWGGEDIEFRLRLHALHRLSFRRIPLSLLEPIEHDDALRTQFYEEQDIGASDRNNYVRVVHNLIGWRAAHAAMPPTARGLFFQRPTDAPSATEMTDHGRR
jgi:hypothetical protein